MSPRNPYTVGSKRANREGAIARYAVIYHGKVIANVVHLDEVTYPAVGRTKEPKTVPAEWMVVELDTTRHRGAPRPWESRTEALDAYWKRKQPKPVTGKQRAGRKAVQKRSSEPTSDRQGQQPRSEGRNEGSIHQAPAPATSASSTTVIPPADDRRCEWCDRKLPSQEGRGRPRQFCDEGCRGKAKRARLELMPEAMAAEIEAHVAAARTLAARVAMVDAPAATWCAEAIERSASKMADAASVLVPAELPL